MTIRGIAHRGFPTRYPENTIASFQAALDASYSHMELDVHLSKDGVPVVIHDQTINRTTNGKGKVNDYTVDELKQFKAGDDGSETIPTLEEVFRLARGKIEILVELKQCGPLYPGLEQKVIDTARKLDIADQLIVTSFDHYALVRTRELDRDIKIGLLMGGSSPCVFPFMKELGSTYMSIPIAYLSEEYDRICRDNGVQLIARPVDTEEAMKKMLRFPDVLASTNTLALWKQFVEANREIKLHN
ncbi:MAG: glycerophosphodiester phosphodiesterase [Paenibacillus sp.]|jgi:glycerophosphoryl diester phosphodiesterase|nr:glycerophosphodiester phosphodiesterase [Paenibacillus sp.]